MLSKELGEYLKGNEWEEGVCPRCHRTFWKKKYMEKETCQEVGCQNRAYTFQDILKRSPRIESLKEVDTAFERHFQSIGYEPVAPRRILRGKDTLFTIAGIQNFDDVLEGRQPAPQGKYAFCQPSVRVEDLGRLERHTTSFNMLSTHRFNASWKEYAENLDEWLSFFTERMRLPVQEFTLAEDVWQGGGYGGKCIEIFMGGLEFSTHVFIENPMAVIDIGAGLERLAWLSSKMPTIFHAIGPLDCAISKKYVAMDTLRTLSLLVGSGISADKKGAGYVVRQLVSHGFDDIYASDVERLVEYYYGQWASFITLPIDPSETCERIRRFILREFNARLINGLEAKARGRDLRRIDLPPDDYVKYLYENGVYLDGESRSA